VRIVLGILILLISVIGGYVPNGTLNILFQPYEILIIVGGAFGALVIATPWRKVKKATSRSYMAFTGGINKEHYLQAMTLMFKISKRIQSKGLSTLEIDLFKPEESMFFQQFPIIYKDKETLHFIADTMNLKFFNIDEEDELEAIIDGRLAASKKDDHYTVAAIASVGQALPAFGIVAAIMGIIITMGHIDGSSVEIAQHMSAALVGTFLGILIAYGVVSPSAEAISHVNRDIQDYRNCIKFGILAQNRGRNAPAIAEIMRQYVSEHLRPTFEESETYYLGFAAR
jgi:chemotaxis protein MotA